MCVFFTTFCNSSLTYTTYKPSHRSHTIIPLSNHHTIIILKSHNLRNIYIYISVTGTEAAGAAAIDVKLRKRMNELEK